MEYKFTEHWFGNQDLNIFLDKNGNKLDFLEIGSFEGKSTVWFLENILTHPDSTITCIDPWTSYSQNTDSFNSYGENGTEWNFNEHKNTFLFNIQLSGFSNKVKIEHGLSTEILPRLITEKKQYDIIFIDGNHTTSFVISDAVMSWYLLKIGGIMIFDDYIWGQMGTTLAPKLAVDSFVSCFADYLQVIWKDGRLAIKRIK